MILARNEDRAVAKLAQLHSVRTRTSIDDDHNSHLPKSNQIRGRLPRTTGSAEPLFLSPG
jgi:hypothetical protein